MEFQYPFKTNNIFEIRDNFKEYRECKSILMFSNSIIENPTISIVIPTYNDDYLIECVDSALYQINAPEYEIVIVDNNIESNKDQLLTHIEECGIKRVRYYKNQKNIGMLGNWNRCIELAKSKYIVYLHSDDKLVPDCLAILWNAHNIIPNKKAAILNYFSLIDNNSNIIGKRRCERKFFSKEIYKLNKFSMYMLNYSTGCGALLNKEVMMEIGGWNPKTYPTADFCGLINYQIENEIYFLKKETVQVRIAINESFKVAHVYRECRYYMTKQIIDRFFGSSRLLRKMNLMRAKSYDASIFDVEKKNLAIYERFMLFLEKFAYSFVRLGFVFRRGL